jgi:hypothetical protein
VTLLPGLPGSMGYPMSLESHQKYGKKMVPEYITTLKSELSVKN